MKMEQTECSETSAYKFQTPGIYPKRKHTTYRTRRKLKIKSRELLHAISGFRRGVDQMWTLLGCYAGQNGSLFQTSQDNLSVPSSRVKLVLWRLDRQVLIETSLTTYHFALR